MKEKEDLLAVQKVVAVLSVTLERLNIGQVVDVVDIHGVLVD